MLYIKLSGGVIMDKIKLGRTNLMVTRSGFGALPIWGIQRESELDEFIALEKNPPALDEAMWSIINKDRSELAGDFCRGCGYCLPCPAGIEIPTSARITLLLGRAPYNGFLEDNFKEKMELINNCIECGHYKNH